MGLITNETVAARLSLEKRKRLSIEERLQWLEHCGEVPEDADYVDWHLSEKTSWWGKPLNPKDFWKGLVVWNDKVADRKARRHGRAFPPIPGSNAKYLEFSDQDQICSVGGVESDVFDFHGSDRENAFWNDFFKSEPKPADELNREILKAAKMYFHTRSTLKLDSAGVDFYRSSAKADGKPGNYPPEEFTDDALFWTYVLEQRAEYESYLSMRLTTNDLVVVEFFGTLKVDRQYITDPLSSDQIKAAKAWKIAYLSRLKKQGIDTFYINAYMEAWNLTSNEVFTAGN